ncbi:hypothetical protein TNCV_5082111 [Trichonephila clavipes]|nr:hypothetical protein TNCV_5082111 [Trichonephila clavipes]
MSDIGPFPGYFLSDKQYHSRQISWRLQSDDRLNLLSSENSTHAQSCSVELRCSRHHCKTGSTVLSGQWDTHTKGLRAYSPPPSNVWQQFFGRSAFLRQQETDLPPAELWCACSFC